MKRPRLYGSEIHGEGTVKFPDDWGDVHPVTRADLLSDWIFELEKAKKEAVEAIGPIEVQQHLGYSLDAKPDKKRQH